MLRMRVLRGLVCWIRRFVMEDGRGWDFVVMGKDKKKYYWYL